MFFFCLCVCLFVDCCCFFLQICDFGMTRDLQESSYYISRGGKIPVKWTAPEVGIPSVGCIHVSILVPSLHSAACNSAINVASVHHTVASTVQFCNERYK